MQSFFRRILATAIVSLICSLGALAQNPQDCSKVPDYNKLKQARLRTADLETRSGERL
jgi:hypothetical protein